MKSEYMVRIAAVFAFALIARPAHAAISETAIAAFDTARNGTDDAAIVATARQLGAEALANPEDARSGHLAFEAAETLCEFGQCADGRQFAAFALSAESGDDLPPLPERTLLKALTVWVTVPSHDHFVAFATALDAVQPRAPTPVSMLAYEMFYSTLGNKDDLHNRFVISTLAANHIRPSRDEYPMAWAKMELRSIANQHSESQDPAVAMRISDLQIWLLAKRRSGPEDSETFKDIYYQTEAWNRAISTYYRSGKYNGNAELDRARYNLEQAMETIPDRSNWISEVRLPACTGTFVKPPKLRYPTRARIRGYVGAAIVEYDLIDGEVRNIDLLASVPSDVFDKYAIDAMKRAEWKFDNDQENPACDRLGPIHGTYSFEFLMQ